jgi:hypothetical protein
VAATVAVALVGGLAAAPGALSQEVAAPLTLPSNPVSLVRLGALGEAASDAFRIHGTLGLLAGAGGPVPSSPSTAGQRLQGSPRWIVDAGAGVARGELPGRTREERRDGGPDALLLAPRLTVLAGVFDGFSPAPAVGGVGSLDLLAEARWLSVPSPSPLEGGALVGGAGIRVGLLRESFTLPGATVVLMHRRVGSLERSVEPYSVTLQGIPPDLGSPGPYQADYRVATSPRVTSLRGVVGKDLLEVGISLGVQRDWMRGDAEVATTVLGPAGGPDAPGTGLVRNDIDISVDRTTWFVGLNRTWVVTQATLELGWSPAARTASSVLHPEFAPPSSVGGAFSGAFSFRITY